MPKRWHHGHSLAAGLLAGLAIERRPELLLGIGFLAGAGAVLAYIGGRRLAGELLAAFRVWRARGMRQRPNPRAFVRSAQDRDGVPY